MTGNKPHILITGGFGNLGSRMSAYFIENGFPIFILTNSDKNLFPGKSNVNVIRCDISNHNDCKEKLGGISFDYVIHLASCNENFEKDYFIKAYAVNTAGTRNLLEALDKKCLKNFIYFSTIHVYGPAAVAVTENSPARPANDYAATHYFAEQIVEQFHRSQQLPYTILRLSNSYGAPKDLNSDKWYLLFNDLVRSAVEKEYIPVKTNGQPLRDYIWMDDVCNAVGQLIALPAPNDTFNLSSGQSLKVIEVAEKVQTAYKKVFGKDIEIRVNTEDKNSYSTELNISNSKLRKLINLPLHDKFSEEAEQIMQLLKNHS
jgi:UDP-glucose 4-epimerase